MFTPNQGWIPMPRPPVTSRTGHRDDRNECKEPGQVFKPGKQANHAERIALTQQRTTLSSLIDAYEREIGFARHIAHDDNDRDKGIG
jgi:hypothetical protein